MSTAPLPSPTEKGKALLSSLLLESIAASFNKPGTAQGLGFRKFRETFNRVFEGQTELPESSDLKKLHSQLAQSDLDRLGQRARVQMDRPMKPNTQTKEAWKILTKAIPNLEVLTNLDELLRTIPRDERAAWRLFFSTRPLGVAELNLLDPRTQLSLAPLCSWLRCLRGNRAQVDDANEISPSEPTRVEWSAAPDKPLVAITSFRTDIKSWEDRVKGTPDLSLARFNRLSKIVRSVCQLDVRPHYVVFPELSIPREWVFEIASSLHRSGISMIAGVEYEISISDENRHCHNPVFMVLQSTDLGYRTYRLFRQDKTLPALEEEDDLHTFSNLTLCPKEPFDHGYLDDPESPRPVFQHGNLHFGVLICNELTDIALRSSYRGKVDALFVAEWNKDIKTFAPLVEATANDVHCFVIQVNNREYGDSRIRVPAKNEWNRDIVRLQGGVNDYVVVGELNVPALRDFQSRHRSPTGANALFKPVPTGFRMSESRNENLLLNDE